MSQDNTNVLFETSLGNFVLGLNAAKAPTTVANFLKYVDSGHFDGTVFHRVIKGFMIQGGGFDVDMKQKPVLDPIANEAKNGLVNDKYTVAMARTNDPHSATAQFFINVKDNDFLNFTRESGSGWGYAVFGQVVEGTDVIDAIEKVRTGRSGFHDDVPLEAVVINKASRQA
jgi:peptidyl-prolyl cis-trans isomerase B (cyclophilin B)